MHTPGQREVPAMLVPFLFLAESVVMNNLEGC
jgi:hypothetical protein